LALLGKSNCHSSQDSLSELNRQLQKERDESTNRLASLQQATNQPRGDNSELLRLRAEVGRLRNESRDVARTASDPDATEMKSWLERVKRLKEKTAQFPGLTIPEFQFLSDEDWLDTARKAKQMDSEADVRKALSSLRRAAKSAFGSVVEKAMTGYSQANNGQLPSGFADLKPYLSTPLDETLLQGYEFPQPGVMADKPISLIDPDGNYQSSRIQVSPHSVSTTSYGEDGLKQAIQAFSAANNGQPLNNPSQLLPYVQTPDEQERLNKVIKSFNQTPTGPPVRDAQRVGP